MPAPCRLHRNELQISPAVHGSCAPPCADEADSSRSAAAAVAGVLRDAGRNACTLSIRVPSDMPVSLTPAAAAQHTPGLLAHLTTYPDAAAARALPAQQRNAPCVDSAASVMLLGPKYAFTGPLDGRLQIPLAQAFARILVRSGRGIWAQSTRLLAATTAAGADVATSPELRLPPHFSATACALLCLLIPDALPAEDSALARSLMHLVTGGGGGFDDDAVNEERAAAAEQRLRDVVAVILRPPAAAADSEPAALYGAARACTLLGTCFAGLLEKSPAAAAAAVGEKRGGGDEQRGQQPPAPKRRRLSREERRAEFTGGPQMVQVAVAGEPEPLVLNVRSFDAYLSLLSFAMHYCTAMAGLRAVLSC